MTKRKEQQEQEIIQVETATKLPISLQPTIETRKLADKAPKEFYDLIEEARQIIGIEQMEAAERVRQEKAEIYVPRLYAVLRDDAGYTPKQARIIIIDECFTQRHIWSKDHILNFIPAEAKYQQQRDAGKRAAEARKIKKQETNTRAKATFKEKLKNDITQVVGNAVGLANADEETKQRVAQEGAAGLAEKLGEEYGEHQSENGKLGMASRFRVVELTEQYCDQIATALREAIKYNAQKPIVLAHIEVLRDGSARFLKAEPSLT